MFKDNRYINAGQNEFYRYGHKAVEKVESYLEPNEQGFYSIPADGGNYWTIGTSTGKYGEFAKYEGTFLSVNSRGNVWAKAGTEKAEAFVKMLKDAIESMKKRNAERISEAEEEEE